MLSLSNYYTTENKYLSNSKISDYLRSANYFYRKHITHEIDNKTTKAMVTGLAVDFLLAQDDAKPVFKVVERKNLKNPPEGYIEVNQTDYDEITSIADAVANTKVFQDIDKNFDKQMLLTVDKKINKYWDGLCGLPDYIKVNDDEIIIVDLKTSITTDTRKYYYHCRDFNYFNQAAMYQMLALEKFGKDKKISSYHLTVDKQKDIYNVRLFKLDQAEIDRAKYALQQIIEEISNRTDWSRDDVNWDSAITLSDPNSDEAEFDDVRTGDALAELFGRQAS